MQNWELEVQIFTGLVFEALTLLGPLGTFKVETMDEHSLRLRRELFLNTAIIALDDIFLWSELRLDLIEGPFLL
jgi:hypothetical protein